MRSKEMEAVRVNNYLNMLISIGFTSKGMEK